VIESSPPPDAEPTGLSGLWPDLPWASDWLSVVGLALTLITFVMAWRAWMAARKAEQAAKEASESLLRHQDSVRVETAFQKVGGILEGYTASAIQPSVPTLIMGLREDLDRVRVGPHFKGSEAGEEIQRYVRGLGIIHREVSQVMRRTDGVTDPQGPGVDDVRDTLFEQHHELLMDLHSYLRDLESETREEDGHVPR
jgi:hypothetical protein